MNYNALSPKTIASLQSIVTPAHVITEKSLMEDYTHDEYIMESIRRFPEAVVKPRTSIEVSSILKLASAEHIPVTVRGGATGLSGGCVPLCGGISLSMEKMNAILEVDTANMMAVVEAGVTLKAFYTAVESSGLFFPPHPGDESAMIGGVIATNAGGARAVKYGVMRNFVKGMEIVCANGDIIEIGGKLMKNSTGYNLLHLIMGSEGTLAVITKAIISLIPEQKSTITLIAPFEELHDAIATVPAIIAAGKLPMAIEFIEKKVLLVTERYLDATWPCRDGNADLMIILDGVSEEDVMRSAEEIGEICLKGNALDVFIADAKDKQAQILKIRSQIYEAIKRYTVDILDIVVPRSSIADYVDAIRDIEKQYGIWLPTFGHAGDGNVHTHLLRATFENDAWTELPEEVWKEHQSVIVERLGSHGKSFGGLISGEHGIGCAKKRYLPDSIGEKQIGLMKGIKRVFDPQLILNPGKVFDMDG